MSLIVKKILVLGYGYVARRLAARAIAAGWAVSGTIREADKAAALEKEGVTPIPWTAAGVDPAAIGSADAILISAPPDANGCPALAAAKDALIARERPASWIGYLSSNGVYGDHGGAWVDEASALLATSPRAKNRIMSEESWRALAEATGSPLVMFRLPGIYGPGRSALDTVRKGRAARIVKEGQVFNRAHVDDIAAALHASLDDPSAGDIFNIADDQPAPPQDVIEYACELLGVPPPPLVPIEQANLSEISKSFYADNKRISNALMKERLLPALSCPTYREGLRAILREERAIGIPG